MVVLMAAPLLSVSWALMWTQDTFWNPLFFTGIWVGSTLLFYALGERGYPGWRRHGILILVSIPLWWWFELVNSRVANWEYVNSFDYSRVEYFLLASVAFSTVVPALHSMWRVTIRRLRPPPPGPASRAGRAYLMEVLAGLSIVAMVFAVPALFFPLVWVGPFLTFDGIVGYYGGRSLLKDISRGEWRLAAAVGLAGLMCGVLWEFWNFWSTPNWVYHIPYFGYLHVFEMPILGYIGYIPFAWSVYQLLRIRPLRHYLDDVTDPATTRPLRPGRGLESEGMR